MSDYALLLQRNRSCRYRQGMCLRYLKGRSRERQELQKKYLEQKSEITNSKRCLWWIFRLTYFYFSGAQGNELRSGGQIRHNGISEIRGKATIKTKA